MQVEGKGRGVVSTRPFSKGELICEYSGKHIPYEEAKRREEEYKGDPSVGCYMVYCVFKEKKFWSVQAVLIVWFKNSVDIELRLIGHSSTCF